MNRTVRSESAFKQPSQVNSRLRRRAALWLVVAVVLGVTTFVQAGRPAPRGASRLPVMSMNAYDGVDMHPAVALDPDDPNYQSNLVYTVTVLYQGLVASDPPARMAGLAREISAVKPALVAVQEAYTVMTAPGTSEMLPGQFTVTYDYLELLVDALASRGLDYTIAVSATESGITLPMLNPQTGALMFGGIVDHDAILVRSDLMDAGWQVSNPQTAHFHYSVEIPTPMGTLNLTRGWCSVDVTTPEQTFRFICTHLEEAETSPVLQKLQAQELLAGPADVSMPVMIAGDLNADPFQRTGDNSYSLFRQAGFADSWNVVYPRRAQSGLTWGHDGALSDPSTKFTTRLDFILYRGGSFEAQGASVIDLRLRRSEPPFWPSDHGALAVQFSTGAKRPRR